VSPSTPVPPVSGRWKEYYESAILEPDYGRLAQRIADARSAILDRAEEILTHPSGEERRLLNSALRTLSVLEESAHRREAA